MKLKKNIIFLLPVFITIISGGISEARPGGGHSYGGGGGSSSSHSSSSSGGSSGDIGFIIDLIWVIFRYIIIPIWDFLGKTIGYGPRNIITLILVAIAIAIFYYKEKFRQKDYVVIKNNFSGPTKSEIETKQNVLVLENSDPNFSKTLFIDFVGSLYQKFYAYYGKKEFTNLTPFLPADLIHTEKNNSGIAYSDIVIGGINIIKVLLNNDKEHIRVEIFANYTLIKNGAPIRYETSERWNFVRNKGVISKEPEQMRTISCPNCGAPANFTDAGKCLYCETMINNGEMQWTLNSRAISRYSQFNGIDAGGYAVESATNTPTIFQDNLENNKNRLLQLHKADNWHKYSSEFTDKIVSSYFLALYSAWSNNNLKPVRSLLSDRLYESWQFWIDNYKAKNWSNKLENIKIAKIELVAIDLDKFYESITVRVFASCFDYTVDNLNNVIGGSKKKAREFTEYWTFIRTIESENNKKADNFNIKSCPSCGNAADKISQAGVCEYCGSKISNGDFSWVLTIITQDDEYRG